MDCAGQLDQVGGHGERIAQCSTVRLRTLKTIPIQIDGEPSRLPPASISIALHSRANCILRSKKRPQLERQRGYVAHFTVQPHRISPPTRYL